MIYHILNGDALKEQFPDQLNGTQIVFRECLVDGPVEAEHSQEFFDQRASFIAKDYHVSIEDYHSESASQLKEIEAIPLEAEVNLWFEDDLFCQVNFWYAMHQLGHRAHVYLVRPTQHTRFGFGSYDSKGLIELFSIKLPLHSLDTFCSLWEAYASHDLDKLQQLGSQLSSSYPFVLEAIKAHLDRQPVEGPGKPLETLAQIKKDLATDDFGLIFREFSKRLPIYGFGDLQVKRLLAQLG